MELTCSLLTRIVYFFLRWLRRLRRVRVYGDLNSTITVRVLMDGRGCISEAGACFSSLVEDPCCITFPK